MSNINYRTNKKLNLYIVIIISILVLVWVWMLFNTKIGPTDNSSNDTQIQSELSQFRSNIEQYRYDNNDQYVGYKDNPDWQDLKNALPECSQKILDKNYYRAKTENGYQLIVYKNGYVAWAPLCEKTNKSQNEVLNFFSKLIPFYKNEIEEDDIFNYCLDSNGNSGIVKGVPDNLKGKSCKKVFGITFEE